MKYIPPLSIPCSSLVFIPPESMTEVGTALRGLCAASGLALWARLLCPGVGYSGGALGSSGLPLGCPGGAAHIYSVDILIYIYLLFTDSAESCSPRLRRGTCVYI